MDLEIGQIFSQIVAFLIMIWVMKRYAWKPILGLMEERRKKIESEFELIEERKKEVNKLLDDYHEKLAGIEARTKIVLQNAEKEGQKISQEIQDDAHKKAEVIIKKGQDEIEKEIAKAKIQLKSELVNLIISATQKMVQQDLDPEKQKQLITKFISEADLK